MSESSEQARVQVEPSDLTPEAQRDWDVYRLWVLAVSLTLQGHRREADALERVLNELAQTRAQEGKDS